MAVAGCLRVRVRAAVALCVAVALATGCGGRGDAASSAPGPQASSDGPTRADIDANPLEPELQVELDDCLEERIGRRDLGADGMPSAEDLAAYEDCARDLGVLDRVRVVEDGAGVDVDAENATLRAEAECLEEQGWEAEPEPADERGLIFWRYPEIEAGDDAVLDRWNADRRACGTDVPEGPDAEGDG